MMVRYPVGGGQQLGMAPKKVTQSNIEKYIVNASNGLFAPRLRFVFS